MKPITKSYLYIHIAVLLWGITAILGKLISYNEYVLVWWRMLLVSLSFLFFKKTWKGIRKISKGHFIRIASVGVLVAIHWVFFYGAIKYSNVSVTLSIMATISFMTAILEPLITGRRFLWYELLLGLLVIPGIYLIFYFSEAHHTTGIIMAFLSALFAALFTSFNKKYVKYTNAYTFSFVQLSTGFLFLTIGMPIYINYFPESWFIAPTIDFVYIIILAFFCTTIPYVLGLKSLHHLNAFTTNLITNLEPVYGIVLAWLVFQENKDMGWRFYIGTAIILLSVFFQPYLRKQFEKKSDKVK